MPQDVVAGDGTTSVVVICGALLSKCIDLLARGVHPTIISDAFGLAARKAVEVAALLTACPAHARPSALPMRARGSLGPRVPPAREPATRLVWMVPAQSLALAWARRSCCAADPGDDRHAGRDGGPQGAPQGRHHVRCCLSCSLQRAQLHAPCAPSQQHVGPCAVRERVLLGALHAALQAAEPGQLTWRRSLSSKVVSQYSGLLAPMAVDSLVKVLNPARPQQCAPHTRSATAARPCTCVA